MEQKPTLDKHISIQDFRDFYWYKEELLNFCRAENLNKSGGKLELADRIEKYLETGEKETPKPKKKKKSHFDWGTEHLSPETLITDNYKNTENVRAFFSGQIGDKFKFNVKFMNWMKQAEGQTLGDAINQWHLIAADMAAADEPKNIAPQFEFNRYIRDFLKDNPTMERAKAIECWKIKKSKRGENSYERSDLEFI